MDINRMLHPSPTLIAPRHWAPLLATFCLAAGVATTSGCFVFEGLYAGPYPCEDDSNCPGETICGGDGFCSEEAGEPCETDQSCPDGQYCNTTANVCGDGNVFEDDFVVTNRVDVDDLVQYHRVRGAILIGPDDQFDSNSLDRGITELSLPRLVSANQITIENQQSLTTIDLPALTRVGSSGLDIVNNGALESLTLPALNDVDRIDIVENASLQTIRLDSIVRIAGFGGGLLTIDDNQALELLNLPALEFVNFLSVADSGNGAAPFVINAPNLAEVGLGMVVASSYTIEALDFPRLATVGGVFSFNDTQAMTTYSMPALTTIEGDFYMNSHEVLETFAFPSLTTIGGDVDMGFNPLLRDCDLIDFFDGITVGGVIEVEDNASCE